MRSRPTDHSRRAIGFGLLVLATAALIVPGAAARQAGHYPLESVDGLRLHNVTAQPATLQGKKGVRVTISDEAVRRLQGMTPADQAQVQQLALVEGVDFGNGVIQAEIAGAPAPGAPAGA